jgi:hypothetical protein
MLLATGLVRFSLCSVLTVTLSHFAGDFYNFTTLQLYNFTTLQLYNFTTLQLFLMTPSFAYYMT